MADDPNKVSPTAEAAAPSTDADATPGASSDDEREREERSGISDFVRRAVSAGVGAASRSKDDIMRVAASEVRAWLDHMNLSDEIAKAMAKMVIEVKTEIRFRPNEDGKLVPETTNDIKLKPPK